MEGCRNCSDLLWHSWSQHAKRSLSQPAQFRLKVYKFIHFSSERGISGLNSYTEMDLQFRNAFHSFKAWYFKNIFLIKCISRTFPNDFTHSSNENRWMKGAQTASVQFYLSIFIWSYCFAMFTVFSSLHKWGFWDLQLSMVSSAVCISSLSLGLLWLPSIEGCHLENKQVAYQKGLLNKMCTGPELAKLVLLEQLLCPRIFH